MLATAGRQLMIHLEQCHANDGHMAELSKKLREAALT